MRNSVTHTKAWLRTADTDLIDSSLNYAAGENAKATAAGKHFGHISLSPDIKGLTGHLFAQITVQRSCTWVCQVLSPRLGAETFHFLD